MTKGLVERNPTLYSLRAVLIFFVIVAHSTLSTSSVEWINDLWLLLGTFGVGGFFILSGLMSSMKKNLNKERIILRLIPWFTSAVLIYISLNIFNLSVIRGIDFLLFFIGYQSFYYFMTILFVLDLSYQYLPFNKTLVWVFIGLISILLTQFGILPFPRLVYLNPLNWVSFYSLGYYLNQHKKQLSLKISAGKIIFLVLTVWIYIIFHWNTYFTIQNILLECIVVYLIYNFLNRYRFKILEKVGMNSYLIYLFHIPFISLLNRLMVNAPLYFQIFKPVLVFILFIGLLSFLKWLFNKYHDVLFIKILILISGINSNFLKEI